MSEAIYAQVDQEGRYYQLLDSIIDHRRDGNAIGKEDGFWTSKNKVPEKTTKGWQLCVQ